MNDLKCTILLTITWTFLFLISVMDSSWLIILDIAMLFWNFKEINRLEDELEELTWKEFMEFLKSPQELIFKFLVFFSFGLFVFTLAKFI